jgi:hypothetical protein
MAWLTNQALGAEMAAIAAYYLIAKNVCFLGNQII